MNWNNIASIAVASTTAGWFTAAFCYAMQGKYYMTGVALSIGLSNIFIMLEGRS